jgi:hypothetical protein
MKSCMPQPLGGGVDVVDGLDQAVDVLRQLQGAFLRQQRPGPAQDVGLVHKPQAVFFSSGR